MDLTFEPPDVARLPKIGRVADNCCMESTDDLGPELIVPSKRAQEAEQRAQQKTLRGLSARWGKEHAQRVDVLTKELLSVSTDAPADETMLLRTAATTSAVSEILGRAQLQLATRVEQLLDQPKLLVAVARSLKEVTAVQAASTRSFQELLEAAATMRAQRSIARAHAKKEKTWHEQVGGAAFDSSRRDSAGRHPAAN